MFRGLLFRIRLREVREGDDLEPRARVPPDEVEAMRRNVVRAYRLYFTNQTARWRGIISTLSRRVRCLAAE